MGMHHSFMHFEHMMHDWIRDERARRIRPEVDIALAVLRRKYGDGNPFDGYLPLCRAATPELRALVQEHQLPNGTASPWRASWEARLDDEHVESDLHPPSSFDGNAEDHSAQVADSVIKRRVTEHLMPTETWDNFVQRLYEQHVVQNIGNGAGNANKKGNEGLSVWTVEAFCTFVRSLTHQLNSHGYNLKTPDKTRLETLLTKTSKGEYLYGSSGW